MLLSRLRSPVSACGCMRRAFSTRKEKIVQRVQGELDQDMEQAKANEDGISIKIDPKEAKTFEDLQIRPAIVDALKRAFPEVSRPTTVQRNMLALLNSDMSLLVKSPAGTGKTLATALYMLNTTAPPALRQQGENNGLSSVTNLLVVPTAALAEQYRVVFEKLIDGAGLEPAQVVQAVFRTDKAGEKAQEDKLREHPGPHILVGTPARLLDLLSSGARACVPLHGVYAIAVDEADTLLPVESVHSRVKQTRKVARHRPVSLAKPPAQLLLDHVVAWRNAWVQKTAPAFIPLKVLLESSTASSRLKAEAAKRGWISGRPMLRLGLDDHGGNSGNKSLQVKSQVPRDVCSYFVTYNPFLDTLENTDYDVSSILPEMTQNAFDVVGEVNDERVKKHVQEYAALSKPQREKLLGVYAAGLVKAMKVDAQGGKLRRALVVVPEAFSISNLVQILESRYQIPGATLATVGNSSGVYSGDSSMVKDDTNTLFLDQDKGEEGKDLPQVVLVRARAVAGLDWPGLDRIYALGWDSLLSSKTYLSVAGRCRAAPASERNKAVPGHEFWRAPEDRAQGKFVVISTIDETSDMRYRMLLAVSMAKIGAKQQSFL
ncbi:uncharacterized protein SAPINGB_P003573 [Magnusiomyces paraingens]|uniref:RNA helicase n=1 Tax=Magnusiomyces paraingens TaxID=2606893 RepID=A0A5E8BVF4_9ASCO|nr:uncharacterized protein SAPINGB_P003573 [Saprochaete ingens]VVT53437.1 unnamed protein product [Saprochaete ingens]